MNVRCIRFALLAGAVLLFGCDKPKPAQPDPGKTAAAVSSPAPAATPAARSGDGAPDSFTGLLARVHWVGKKRLAADTNAATLLQIWNLPEGERLEKQTLDKLAAAPARLLHLTLATNLPLATNQPSTLLRSLLDDLVREESWVEVRGATNQPDAAVLAVRLTEAQAGAWRTNLAAWVESLAGLRSGPANLESRTPATNGSWSLTLPGALDRIEFARAGDWTLIGLGRGTNALLADLAGRIQSGQAPFPPRDTNHWLEVDLQGFAGVFPPRWWTTNLPRTVSLTVAGEGGNVRTAGEMVFPHALRMVLEPWRIPTNTICDPLVSFTAIRGTVPWLGAWSAWRGSEMGPAPNQVFFWAQSPALWLHFLTFPVANGSNFVSVAGQQVLREWNPVFQTNRVGGFEWATNAHRLIWRGVPYFQPVLESVKFDQSDFALIGLFPNNATNLPAPRALFEEFDHRPNLVYYDWEMTALEVTSWIQMGQLMRMVSGHAQLPSAKASLPWLRAAAQNLRNAVTVVTLDAPDRISLIRSSTCGLTGIELHLLAEWLESPEFPRGLHSLLVQRARRIENTPQATGTNAPPR